MGPRPPPKPTPTRSPPPKPTLSRSPPPSTSSSPPPPSTARPPGKIVRIPRAGATTAAPIRPGTRAATASSGGRIPVRRRPSPSPPRESPAPESTTATEASPAATTAATATVASNASRLPFGWKPPTVPGGTRGWKRRRPDPVEAEAVTAPEEGELTDQAAETAAVPEEEAKPPEPDRTAEASTSKSLPEIKALKARRPDPAETEVAALPQSPEITERAAEEEAKLPETDRTAEEPQILNQTVSDPPDQIKPSDPAAEDVSDRTTAMEVEEEEETEFDRVLAESSDLMAKSTAWIGDALRSIVVDVARLAEKAEHRAQLGMVLTKAVVEMLEPAARHIEVIGEAARGIEVDLRRFEEIGDEQSRDRSM